MSTTNIFKRDAKGLLEGVNYVFDDAGRVNWRKMVPKEYLVPNELNFKKRKQEVPSSIDGLEDKDLLITLFGIKTLLKLRGVSKVSYPVVVSSPEHCTAVCEITWLPNFEEDGQFVTTSAIGDATPFNTKSFGRIFLGPVAQNRALTRAVKDYLGINILGQDEIGEEFEEDDKNHNTKADPVIYLQSLMTEKHKTFEQIKSRLVKRGNPAANDYTSINEIPKSQILDLIQDLKNIKSPKH